MKTIRFNERSKAKNTICIADKNIGAISKKVISYPASKCIKEEKNLL